MTTLATLTMRRGVSLMNRVLLFLLIAVSARGGEPWPGIPFTEVRAYAWPKDHHRPDDRGAAPVMLSKMALRADVINQEGARLNPEQVIRLQRALSMKGPLHDILSLYLPHNAFVFFDAAKKPVAFVEISFCRLRHEAVPGGVSIRPDLLALAQLFHELKLPMGEFADFEAFQEFFRGRQ